MNNVREGRREAAGACNSLLSINCQDPLPLLSVALQPLKEELSLVLILAGEKKPRRESLFSILHKHTRVDRLHSGTLHRGLSYSEFLIGGLS